MHIKVNGIEYSWPGGLFGERVLVKRPGKCLLSTYNVGLRRVDRLYKQALLECQRVLKAYQADAESAVLRKDRCTLGKVKNMYFKVLDELEPEPTAVEAKCSSCKQQQMLWSDETPDCIFCGRAGTVEPLEREADSE